RGPARSVSRGRPGPALERGAMVEPVSVALHARQLTPLAPDDTVVVFGAGLIGLMLVQVLRAAGLTRIVSVDIEDDRLALARELGAVHTINSRSADAPEKVRQLTDGRGADVAFGAVAL